MTLARVKNWLAAETLTASDLNAEFNNLINNPGSLICPIGFNLTFTDATYDIGASGATRPRDLFLSRNAVIGGTLNAIGNVTLGTAGSVKGAALFSGNTSGVVTVQSAAAAGTWSFTWPTDAGTNSYVLQTNGSGVTSWTAAAGTPATQAEQESASSTSVVVTPGRQKHHPSAAKAWAKFGVAGDVVASSGVTSVADSATGSATITWSTAFSTTADYVVQVTIQNGPGGLIGLCGSQGATSCVINAVSDFSTTYADPVYYHVVAFGDQ